MIKKILKSNQFINNIYTDYKWKERRVTWGKEHADKTFYVIRRSSDNVGLFSYVMTNLGHVKYAIENGYIPVIDMQNYKNTYIEEVQLGKENAWEMFFKQPVNVKLQDIRYAKNIILSAGGAPREYPGYPMAVSETDYHYWNDFAKTYLTLQPEIYKAAEAKRQELFQNRTVLGVLYRGTDYTRLQPAEHPIQPTMEEVISEVNRMQRENHYDIIYLATEDESAFQRMKKEYGDRLVATQAKRFLEVGDHYINDIIYGEDNKRYVSGKNYLINVFLLSRCDALIAGCSGGTYGALLLTQGYKEKMIFTLGLY